MHESLSLSLSLVREGRRARLSFSLEAREGEVFLNAPGGSCAFEGRIRTEGTSSRLQLALRCEADIELESLVLSAIRPLDAAGSVFMNGYQSWTDSREFYPEERMDRLGLLARLANGNYKFDRYGDYSFVRQGRRRGSFHGHSYMYFRGDDGIELIGSLDEDSAFTVFHYDCSSGELRAERDCRGRRLKKGDRFAAFDLGLYRGDDEAAFDAWFADIGRPAPAAKPIAGWTSWYDHYQNIGEGVVLENLAAFRAASRGERIFQIDDGYQTAVGDWLSLDSQKFPHGLKPIVERIHGSGCKAGLWLAPFAAEYGSRLAAEHPEWILRDDRGRPLSGGSNWGGFYCLDIRQPGFVDYLRRIFDTVLRDWGFDMVKLDFLYAACLRPFPEATRGELMAAGMKLLRELSGDKLILGCGVPLASAFGRVDYCRVGCDIGLEWEEPWFMRRMHRERVSTPRTLRNTVGRRHLDGRAFMNDPDVFILRDARNKLSPDQRELVFFINTLFGSLVFTSDKVDEYGARQRELFASLDEAMCARLLVLEEHDGGKALELRYERGGRTMWAALNMSAKERVMRFNRPCNAEQGAGAELRLGPFEIKQGEVR
jgi:Alpha-galactosidase